MCMNQPLGKVDDVPAGFSVKIFRSKAGGVHEVEQERSLVMFLHPDNLGCQRDDQSGMNST